MRDVRTWLPSQQKTERAWLFLVFPKYAGPIFQTVSWAQRNKAIISNLRVHWRRIISRLSVHDITAAKIFVCLSVQGFFFCVLERLTFFFGAILFSQSALLSF